MLAALDSPAFRVIVVGAGVTGLVASHCLQKAGIEHVVLERRDNVAPPEGASIAIYPHGSRILHQIGCLKAVQAACVPLDRWLVYKPDGTKIMDNGFFHHLKDNHGSSLLLLERRKFLQILYDGLPDKTPIKTGYGVKDITHTASGVEVTLSDDRIETGDIVLGCDGVYSVVRSIMWDHANKITPGLITVKEKTKLRTAWKSLLGVAPNVPELGQRNFTVVSNKGYTFLGLTQPDWVYFFFIVRVEEPFTWPKRTTYTDQDAEALAESVADHPISDSMVFGELWKKRSRGGLVNLEEGVLDHWHAGRIVLAGDSVHKMTPNIALGGNSGMESIAVICNHLVRMLAGRKGAKPNAAIISSCFAAYQAERLPRMKEILELSSLITKVHAWDTPLHKFLGNWVFPLQADTSMAGQVGAIIRRGAKLDYVNDKGFPIEGRITWKDKEEEVVGSSRSLITFLLMRLLGAGTAVLVVLQGWRLLSFASASV